MLFIYNNNYFTIIINNKKINKILYYNIINIIIEISRNIKNIYIKFLIAINILNITLNYNKKFR